ncbi:MAG: PHB depolymerase family esterase [Candidatus Acidiferrales bacterium]
MNVHRRRILILGTICVLVLGVMWRRTGAWPAMASFASIQAGTQSASLDFGGRIRTYLLHVPPTYVAGTPLPLVFVLHGGGQSPNSAEKMSGMSSKADEKHFIAIYPSGTGRLSAMPTWNSGNCCAYAMQNNIDDVGFLRALIEKLERDYSVDRKRIYFTGISNGAMMSYRMACELSEQTAAIAPVEGALNVDCDPRARVAVLIFHGTADRLVPFNGGSSPFQIGGKREDKSVAYAVDFWVKRDGCSALPAHSETVEVHVDKYSGCQDGTGIELYAIQGGHHMWPGLAISGNSIPATDLIWSFFAAHPKT